MSGRSFETVICAGLSAAKWKANQNPEADLASIASLEATLRKVTVAEFILISTIDVYPVLEGLDETYDCHQQANHPYGRHRLAFEDFVTSTFPDAMIVRLPALFGPGLRKNLIFDLLNGNMLAVINLRSRFQWYDISRLWSDVQVCRQHDLRLMNLFTEPVETSVIVESFFDDLEVGGDAGPRISYDLRTCNSALFGRSDGYIASGAEMLRSLRSFVDNERAVGQAKAP